MVEMGRDSMILGSKNTDTLARSMYLANELDVLVSRDNTNSA
jgi:hypothetical protein